MNGKHAASRIVVGVDGSPHSIAALQWAAHVAPQLNCHIEAISVWTYPASTAMEHVSMPEPSLFEDAARASLHSALDEAFGASKPHGLQTRVVEGYPATELIDASKSAAMLVVGSRGRGGFVGMLLGSVSARCAEHATCPVVVVH